MENGLVNLVNRLPRDRLRHAIVCIEDSSDFARRIERDDVQVYEMHRSKVGVWRLRWNLLRLFRRLRPDIVHTRNMSGLDALLPARLAGARTIHSEHGFDVDNLRGLASRPMWLRRLHAPWVDDFVCVSKDIRRLMVGSWRIASSRIAQIYNGVDTGRFTPASPPRRDLLPQAWGREAVFVVGTVGRLQAVKDQATLIRAAVAACQAQPSLGTRLRVMIVGDGPLRAELQQLATSLGLSEHCWFAGARDDVAALMQHFDLFVLTSLNEGISNTVLEAMATGLPLVVSAVGGNVELVDSSDVGETFAPGDVPRLAALIQAHADDAALCARRSRAARARAEARFSLPAMVGGYEQVYLRSRP